MVFGSDTEESACFSFSRGGSENWTSFSLRAGSKTASALKARRPDTASSILELFCVYSPGKPLAGFEPPDFDATNGYERHRFLLANFHGQAG